MPSTNEKESSKRENDGKQKCYPYKSCVDI